MAGSQRARLTPAQKPTNHGLEESQSQSDNRMTVLLSRHVSHDLRALPLLGELRKVEKRECPGVL